MLYSRADNQQVRYSRASGRAAKKQTVHHHHHHHLWVDDDPPSCRSQIPNTGLTGGTLKTLKLSSHPEKVLANLPKAWCGHVQFQKFPGWDWLLVRITNHCPSCRCKWTSWIRTFLFLLPFFINSSHSSVILGKGPGRILSFSLWVLLREGKWEKELPHSLGSHHRV